MPFFSFGDTELTVDSNYWLCITSSHSILLDNTEDLIVVPYNWPFMQSTTTKK